MLLIITLVPALRQLYPTPTLTLISIIFLILTSLPELLAIRKRLLTVFLKTVSSLLKPPPTRFKSSRERLAILP